MPMLTLYCTPGTISVAVAIALHEAGLPFDQVRVDFATAAQTGTAYRAINPKGRVPALATETGILTETGAILEHVAALAPAAGLVPGDAFQAARMREVMYYLASTMHVNHAHRMRGHRWATLPASFADMAAKVAANMTECCAHIDAHCLQGPLVLGDRISLADPYLFVVSSWLDGDGVDIAAFEKLAGFRAAMQARASVRKVTEQGLL
jgi:glutathione S-transferase